ncbi:MAG TPA: shikimate dehydrogenase [Deltaproteobacteria bacterium]|nr:shikimate dehydrogenase [Deltaproteobacteria bacterium]
MKTYALFGSPIGHSLSPVMHGAAFTEAGVDACFRTFETDRASEVRRIVEEEDVAGACVTIPLKVSLLEVLDEVGDAARRIGAVNTIIRRGNRLLGENTDWIGIARSLEKLMGPIAGKRFLVLGAGGTARAALHAVLSGDGNAVISSRRYDPAHQLAEEFSCEALPLERLELVRADCCINTTPVGMSNYDEGTPLDSALLHHFRWVFDVIYTPRATRLVREALKAGCIAAGGLDMFVYQGAEQFRLWTNLEPPVEVMTNVAGRMLDSEEN